MALIEMDFAGSSGGEHYEETLLWTNPNPTSNFAAQTITLSQSIENFDYIKISYRAGTTNTNEISAIYSVTDIKKMLDSNHIWGATMGVNSSGYYGRYITFDSNTSLAFSLAYNLGSTGNTSNVAYPTRVYGLKKVNESSGNNINITIPDLDTGDVSIGANATGTFVSEKRIKQAIILHLSSTANRGNWVFFVNFEQKVLIFNEAGNMRQVIYDDYVISQTDTSLVWKNNSSVGRSYRLLGWY